MLAALNQRATDLRSIVYDTIIVAMTTRWYREVLLECPLDAALLDVGIGTASSLVANRDIVLSKNLSVTGVDYDLDYVRSAQVNVASSTLQDMVRIVHASIHDYNKDYTEKFDVVYFSGSFMIIPEPSDALRRCVRMLRSPVPKIPGGCNIFFTQTFEKPSLFGRWVTPWVKYFLKLITTIDFGGVTFEADFRQVLEQADVEIVEVKAIKRSLLRTQVLVMARPKLTKI